MTLPLCLRKYWDIYNFVLLLVKFNNSEMSSVVEMINKYVADGIDHEEDFRKRFCLITRSIVRGQFFWKCQICHYKCAESTIMKNHIMRKHNAKLNKRHCYTNIGF